MSKLNSNMLTFSEWLGKNKPWSADKKRTIELWSSLPTDKPIISSKPVPPAHKGSKYSYDGIRITGSGNFINTTLAKIKDLIPYNGYRTSLNTAYRQQVDKTSGWPLQNSYVFYAQVQNKEGLKT